MHRLGRVLEMSLQKQGASVGAYPNISWLHVFFSFILALNLACLAIIYWLEKK